MSCLILSLGHYRYSADLVALDQCHTVKPIRLPYGLDHIVTPLLWQSWQASQADHPDRASINWLIAGIRDGFRIGYDYTRGKPKKFKTESDLGTGDTPGDPGIFGKREC